jgi:hypothetical protein
LLTTTSSSSGLEDRDFASLERRYLRACPGRGRHAEIGKARAFRDLNDRAIAMRAVPDNVRLPRVYESING